MTKSRGQSIPISIVFTFFSSTHIYPLPYYPINTTTVINSSFFPISSPEASPRFNINPSINLGPYSHFRVGCALLAFSPPRPSPSSNHNNNNNDHNDDNENDDIDGNTTIITGANIENASYPVGTCAERCAFGKGVVRKIILQYPIFLSMSTLS